MTSSQESSALYHSLIGRHVLITGGASGIGRAMVEAFAAQKARVTFIDIDRSAAASLVDTRAATFYDCDLRDIPQLRATIETIERDVGPIDVLINNAARDDRQEFLSFEPEDWHQSLSVNLDHQFFASQAVARGMIARRQGAIILMGSVSWMRGQPGIASYTTSKAAINGLNKTLARELGPSGIRVNCIVPGAVLTERQAALWLTPELNQSFINLQALKFRLEPTHIARMALFLASDESAGCTGANFLVDAGLTQN